MSHTPGPWKECVLPDRKVVIRGESVTHGNDVATIICHGYLAPNMPTAEDAANARLIAAAPDMLAALEAVLDRHNYQGDGRPWSHLIEQVKATVRKAKGAAP